MIWWQTLKTCTQYWSISFIVFLFYKVCNSASRLTTFELDCNATCNCDRSKFSPICGRDKNTYFSACHAGCQNTTIVGGKIVSVSFITVFICNRCFDIHWFTEEVLSRKRIYITECSFSAIWRQWLETNVTIHACAYVYGSKGNNILCVCLHVNVDMCLLACTCLIAPWACTFMQSNVNYMDIKLQKY